MGTQQADTLNGTTSVDVLFGLGQSDTLDGQSNSDILCVGTAATS